MNTYKKALLTYYAKRILGTAGFIILFSLSIITSNTNNPVLVEKYYNKFSKGLSYPVKFNASKNVSKSIQAA